MASERPVIEEEKGEGESDEHGFGEETEGHEGGGEPEVTSMGAGGAEGVGGISGEGEEPESGAEEIFAFGDPGDGFDIDGVDGEEEGDGEAGPGIAGEALPDEEDEEGVDGVEGEIGEMRVGGIGAEEGDIEHVGEPGEGDPLGGDEVGEDPEDGARVEAGEDAGVGEDVGVVVEIDELAMESVGINGENEGEEGEGGVDEELSGGEWRKFLEAKAHRGEGSEEHATKGGRGVEKWELLRLGRDF